MGEVVERLCARATASGEIAEPAPYAEVAFEVRDLLPDVDDAELDGLLAEAARAAAHISAAERAEPDELSAYADAAWGAGLAVEDFDGAGEDLVDLDDGPADSAGRLAAFQAAVIEYWDLELHGTVSRLVNSAGAHDSGASRRDAPASA